MFPPLGGIPYSSDTPIPPELDDGKIQRKPAEFLNFPLNYLELNLDMGFGGSLIEDILTIFWPFFGGHFLGGHPKLQGWEAELAVALLRRLVMVWYKHMGFRKKQKSS